MQRSEAAPLAVAKAPATNLEPLGSRCERSAEVRSASPWQRSKRLFSGRLFGEPRRPSAPPLLPRWGYALSASAGAAPQVAQKVVPTGKRATVAPYPSNGSSASVEEQAFDSEAAASGLQPLQRPVGEGGLSDSPPNPASERLPPSLEPLRRSNSLGAGSASASSPGLAAAAARGLAAATNLTKGNKGSSCASNSIASNRASNSADAPLTRPGTDAVSAETSALPKPQKRSRSRPVLPALPEVARRLLPLRSRGQRQNSAGDGGESSNGEEVHCLDPSPASVHARDTLSNRASATLLPLGATHAPSPRSTLPATGTRPPVPPTSTDRAERESRQGRVTTKSSVPPAAQPLVPPALPGSTGSIASANASNRKSRAPSAETFRARAPDPATPPSRKHRSSSCGSKLGAATNAGRHADENTPSPGTLSQVLSESQSAGDDSEVGNASGKPSPNRQGESCGSCVAVTSNRSSPFTFVAESSQGPSRSPLSNAQRYMAGRCPMGLQNLGNTCFLNAALQAIAHAPLLSPFFLHGHFVRDLNAANKLGTGGKLAVAFADLLQKLFGEDGKETSFPPEEFYEAVCRCCPLVGEQRGEQQDAHEVLNWLLDAFHEDLNRVKKRPPYKERVDLDEEDVSRRGEERFAAEAWHDHLRCHRSVLVDLCQGQLRSQVRCCECGCASVTFDPFLFLSLPVPKGLRRGGKKQIEAAIKAFCKEERLDGNDAWGCPRCKKRVSALKRMSLWKLPLLLFVHLKRFGFEASSDWYSMPTAWKIEGEISLPLSKLNLQEFVAETSPQRAELHYDLFAAVDHVGTSPSVGHYTASCRRDDGWWKFDDSYTEFLGGAGDEATARHVLGEGNYMLLFQRRDAPSAPEFICEQSHRQPENWPHVQGEGSEWSFLDQTAGSVCS